MEAGGITRSQSWLFIAFSCFALCNIFDLSSTILALSLGLHETNAALLSLSSSLGVGFVNLFVGLKVCVILSGGMLLFAGVCSRNQTTGKLALIGIITLAAVFAFASVNNFVAILLAL